MECLEGYAAFQASLCVKPFCSILFCICTGNTIRTAVVLYFGDAVVPEFKLLLRGPLVQFIATGRTLLLSPMQLTTCLDVAQTAIFFFPWCAFLVTCRAATFASASKCSINVLEEFRHVSSSLGCVTLWNR